MNKGEKAHIFPKSFFGAKIKVAIRHLNEAGYFGGEQSMVSYVATTIL